MSKLISDAKDWEADPEGDIKEIINEWDKAFDLFLQKFGLTDKKGISSKYWQEIQKFRQATYKEIRTNDINL